LARHPRALLLLILTAIVLALMPAAAGANAGLETAVQEQSLLTATPVQLADELQALRQLGVQHLRIAMHWDAIAPAASSRLRPAGFDATDPAAYPAAAWQPYDTAVQTAARYGIGVSFDVAGGAPLWAAQRAPSAALAHVWYPSASEFGQFVQAAGSRYSGTYLPPGGTARLPKVSSWSVWDEPNAGASSLAPQTVKGVEVAPQLYRSLADAAFASLHRTGHARDTILVGELGPTGRADPKSSLPMEPLRFLRALFCVDPSYRRLSGKAAAQRGCPSTAAASRRFRASNPALFRPTGWSYHPFPIGAAPPSAPAPPQQPDSVALADLARLEQSLDSTQRAYGSRQRFPIYLTEYGYNTRPPQPRNAVSPGAQAAYLNQAEYIAWHDRRVRTLTQYSLVDSPAIPSIDGAFGAGLVFANGQPKPSFDAYRLPIAMPTVTAARGVPLELWGCIRPAHFAIPDTGRGQLAQIIFEPASSGPYLEFGVARVSSASNCYFDLKVQLPESGTVQLAYTYPGNDPSLPAGTIIFSRRVRVRLQ
jgi:hypothetical protein